MNISLARRRRFFSRSKLGLRSIGTVVALACLVFAVSGQGQAPPVWVGVQVVAENKLPAVDGKTLEAGLRVVGMPNGSPAAKAGLAAGDIIVAMDGKEFSGEIAVLATGFRESISKHAAGDAITFRVIRDSITKETAVGPNAEPNTTADAIWRDPEGYLMRQPAGAAVRLTGVRERKLIDINVHVEVRPDGVGIVKRYAPEEAEQRRFPNLDRSEEQLARTLIEAYGIGGDYDDLRQRLARLSDQGDAFRLARVAYVQHNPFQLRTVANDSFSNLAGAVNRRDAPAILRLAADWLDAPTQVHIPPPLERGLALDQHLDQLVRVLQDVEATRREAFARLSPDEQKFLADNAESLFKTFAGAVAALNEDPNAERWQRHARVLELATRVDYRKLFEGAALLWRAADEGYLDDLEAALRKAWETAGKPSGIFIDLPSAAGRILVGGAGSTWYREDAAILLDLGGKDFYTNNAGAPRSGIMPAAMLIDFAGNDSYEATFNWTQGAALLGHGMLIDRKGNDEYVAQEWAQGAAALGTALLVDQSGNDVYRGNQFTQGVAAWGVALHFDLGGDDIYEAHVLSQGVGMAGGAGWLLNAGGNDRYYAKGTLPTNYGDAGIFDSWSQGCAVGFRGLLSGGVALLYDTAGKDRYEAGSFSQGGGYYFGIGMLRDGGAGKDVYVGSRYNQGFAAHQAIGYFEDEGGDDFYTARHAVAQSIAWDEAITAFVDRGGDDIYEGGASFSQGASAHNGFALFLDLGGRNRFSHAMAPGSAGPNDYHGGTSFSLFAATEDGGNTFTSSVQRSRVQLHGERGLFVDLPDSIENALTTRSWKALLKN